MKPEAEKLWQTPEGGKLAAAMMGLRPMGMDERITLDAILTAQAERLAQDAEHWITVHPNGKEHDGHPLLIDGSPETGYTVKGGAGGKPDMLPTPSDPNFTIPDLGEDAFFDLDAPEDEALLATGAWKDAPDDDGLPPEPIDIDASTGPDAQAAPQAAAEDDSDAPPEDI